MKFRQFIHFKLCCAVLAVWLGGAWLGAERRVAGRESQPAALQGAAARARLPQDGQYEALQTALNFTLQQKLAANDGATQDDFGYAVAISGDTLVIGAPFNDLGANANQGAAYIFTRSGGVWTQQAKLSAADGAANDQFGWSVALDGDTLAVGAVNDATGAQSGQGSVYVFTRNGTVWTQQQKLTVNDGAAQDFFGSAVALDYDLLAVGANADDVNANTDQGSVYVFRRNGAGWSQQAKLTANDGAAADRFGAALALAGNTLAVGAPFGDGAQPDQGAAYMFQRSGQSWLQQDKLTASDGASMDRFGWAVALNDSTVAVGAPNDVVGTSPGGGGSDANEGQGSAYTFTRVGSSWAQAQKLVANDGVMGDYFGGALALSFDTLVVSAQRAALGANPRQGSAYVFGGPSNWTQQQKLTAPDGAAYDYFGNAVAVSGSTIVAAACLADLGANADQGAAYVFTNTACPTITIAPASLPNGASGVAYSQQFTASGGNTTAYSFALAGGALPPGLALTSTGLLSGTPTTAGAYAFTVRATAANGLCAGTRAYTLTIAPPCQAFSFDPPTLPNGELSAPYSETLTVFGGNEPYTFSTKGSAPPGLRMSADGVLSGTPTRTGKFSFTVLARDANGCVGSQGYSVTILNVVFERR